MLLLNLIITITIYMGVPLICYFNNYTFDSKKEVGKFVILNSLLVFFILLIFYTIIGSDQLPNVAPTWFYGYINYWLLCKKIDKSNGSK